MAANREITASVGDWVRFYQGGRLVVGVVMYLSTLKYSGAPLVTTDIGEIPLEDILEVRRADGR